MEFTKYIASWATPASGEACGEVLKNVAWQEAQYCCIFGWSVFENEVWDCVPPELQTTDAEFEVMLRVVPSAGALGSLGGVIRVIWLELVDPAELIAKTLR